MIHFERAPVVRRRALSAAWSVLLTIIAIAMLVSATAKRAEAATTCYVATSQAAHVLCWLDFTSYSGSGAAALTIDLPDGSVLTGTVTNTGTQAATVVAIPVYGTANYGGVALGDEDYLGVLGKPGFYGTGTEGPIQLSGLKLTDPQGKVIANVTIAVADDESLDSGDDKNNGAAVLNWGTTGTNWAQLQLMPNPAGSIASVCSLTGLGTAAAKCVPNGNNAPAAAYILSSAVTSAQSVTISSTTNSDQGYAFALQLAQLTVAKTVASRVASGDEFTVQITRAGTVLDSASTTTTGTTASATGVVVPLDTYVLKDVAASGSTANIANYATTVTCANAVTSTTTLPAAGTAAQSVTIVPALDDQITCTFTNNALTLTDKAATPTATVVAGTTQTDSFALTNTSGIAGTFAIVQPTIVTSTGATVTPSSYTYSSKSYATLAALQAAINAAGPTAAGGAITVGVVYTVPGTSGTSATVTLPATIASGTGTSPQATASEVDTITPSAALTIAKTGTTQTSPGGLIAYSILVSNTGPSVANGALFSDPLPAGLTVVGTPTCGTPTGGAACGTVAKSGQNVTSTITTLPVNGSVTFTINASAGTATSYTNTASVAPPSGTNGTTATSSLTTTVSQSNGLQKTVQNVTTGTTATTADTAVPGNTLRYVLTFTNTTGAAISNVAFADTVPAHTTFVTAACPAAGTALPTGIACTPAQPAVGSTGTNVKFPFTGTLASGATVTASIDVKVI